MKTSLLIPAFTLLGVTAFAADSNAPASTPAPNSSAKVSGKATITIDVNGKKETREVDLGNALQVTGSTGASGVAVKTEPAPSKSTATPRTWLGVVTDEPSDEVRAQLPIPDGTGLLVRSVVADSPAAEGGLEKNDVLVRLDDQILANPEQLRALIRTKKEGDTMHVAYLRKGHEASAEVKLGVTTDEMTLGEVSYLGTLIGKSVATEIQGTLKPLIFEGAWVLNKDGQTLNLQGQADGDKSQTKGNEQWSLFSGNVQADVTEQIKNLDKTLRSAGLNDEVIAQTNRAVAEAVAQVQKALSNAIGEKGEIQRNLQQAMDEVKRAVDEARRAAEEATHKAQPVPPALAPAPPKAP